MRGEGEGVRVRGEGEGVRVRGEGAGLGRGGVRITLRVRLAQNLHRLTAELLGEVT